ncbi:hypothetical protein D3C87_1567310 [compost metagenome]
MMLSGNQFLKFLNQFFFTKIDHGHMIFAEFFGFEVFIPQAFQTVFTTQFIICFGDAVQHFCDHVLGIGSIRFLQLKQFCFILCQFFQKIIGLDSPHIIFICTKHFNAVADLIFQINILLFKPVYIYLFLRHGEYIFKFLLGHHQEYFGMQLPVIGHGNM